MTNYSPKSKTNWRGIKGSNMRTAKEEKEVLNTMRIADKAALRMLHEACTVLKEENGNVTAGILCFAMSAARYGLFLDHQKLVPLKDYERDLIDAIKCAIKDCDQSNMRKELDEIERAHDGGQIRN